jgi:hypothetical protein
MHSRIFTILKITRRWILSRARWMQSTLPYTFFCGPTFQIDPGPPYGWGFYTAHSKTHTHTHTHPIRLLATSIQNVSEAATYTTHNQHNKRTSMPSAGFEPAIPKIKRLNTYALDRTAIWIGPQSRTIFQIKLYIMLSFPLTSSRSLPSRFFD